MANTTDGLNGQVSAEPLASFNLLMANTTDVVALVTEAALLTAVPNTVTSGALGVTTRTTFLSVTGTVAYTLANGTFQGQRKSLRCTVAATSPAGTLTPTTVTGFTSILFDAVEDAVELEWYTTSGWHIVKINGAVAS